MPAWEADPCRSQNPHSTASRGRLGHGEDIVAPAGNQPETEKTDEPKLGLERVVKGAKEQGQVLFFDFNFL